MAVITVTSMKLNDTHYLFPTPLLTYELGRTITMGERLVIESLCSRGMVLNHGNNQYTEESTVLDTVGLEGLKTDLSTILNNAFKTIYAPSTDCGLKITQSWLNLTVNGEHHHEHSHPNSFLSAVLYLVTTKGDAIEFFCPPITPLRMGFSIPTHHPNAFNSKVYRHEVGDNMVIVFPSSLVHHVPTVSHNKQRLTLALNTFITGELGTSRGLDYLKI